MTSDVVLTAALRSNLLTLQNTQNLIDKTQFNLATGRKVNSALDNPQNFFTAQSLNNRASDLNRLLDGIGQSVRAIEEANTGISSLTTLVEQAGTIADQAKSEANSVANTAVASSDFNGLDLDAELIGVTNVDDGDTFTIKVGEETTETFTIDGDTTARGLVATINDRASDNDRSFKASIVNDQIQISATNGDRLILADSAGDRSLYALGFFEEPTGADALSETFLAGDTLEIKLTSAGGSAITANTNIGTTAEFTIGGTTSDALTIDVGADGSNAVTLLDGDTGDISIDAFIDLINLGAASQSGGELEGVTATFDNATDTISISFDSTVATASFVGTANTTADFGQGQTVNATAIAYQPSAGTSGNSTLTNLQNDFNEIRSQIDSLVADANFRGTNLLNGDDLLTTFNEDSTSTLTTSGVTFTSSGLEIGTGDFSTSTLIQASIDDVDAALATVRDFGSTIANDLSIIQTRQNFTEQTIQTLNAAADDLTIADQNEEGANLLALQTRQQLGVTSLSLAAQSQQSVLRLF